MLYKVATYGSLFRSPVAVPGVRLADGAAALFTVRLGCPIFSLPINRLRQLSTPAHAYAPLHLPLAAQSNAAAATRSPRFICHRQRSGRSPVAVSGSISGRAASRFDCIFAPNGAKIEVRLGPALAGGARPRRI